MRLVTSDFAGDGDDILTLGDAKIALSGHTLTFSGGGIVVLDDVISADSGGLIVNGGLDLRIDHNDLLHRGHPSRRRDLASECRLGARCRQRGPGRRPRRPRRERFDDDRIAGGRRRA